MTRREELTRRKELILESELVFANRIGAVVFEKPKINMWMILLPILFLHFIYRMQKYRKGRMQFDMEFMLTRRRTMEIAVAAADRDSRPDIEDVVKQSGLEGELAEAYASWVETLAEYYMDLLAAKGDTFESLVRSAYGDSSNCLLALNRLSTAERRFYSAIKPRLADTEGAAEIIARIQEQTHLMRRELAEAIFR